MSFGGRDFPCTIPWHAVFAMTLPDTEHRGRLWPQDVPEELALAMEAMAQEEASRPSLKSIDGGRVEEPVRELKDDVPTDDDDDDDDEPKPSRSHLRLVTD